MAEREMAWIWPKDCYRPPRGVTVQVTPVEWGYFWPARRKPWWRRWLDGRRQS